MWKVGGLGILAAAVAIAIYSLSAFGGREAAASPVNKNVHVHDDFYHPAGAFIVGTGTDHNVAQAACQKAIPDSACDAVIQVGDTITWVAPAPLAANQHTVTECTDFTFSTCGPAVSAASPIDDSGVRNPPPAVSPIGWPYGPIQFNTPGVYYYRCQIHPDVMRGRIVVQGPVGGVGFDPLGGAATGGAGIGPVAIASIVAGAVAGVVALGGIARFARRRAAR